MPVKGIFVSFIVLNCKNNDFMELKNEARIFYYWK